MLLSSKNVVWNDDHWLFSLSMMLSIQAAGDMTSSPGVERDAPEDCVSPSEAAAAPLAYVFVDAREGKLPFSSIQNEAEFSVAPVIGL